MYPVHETVTPELISYGPVKPENHSVKFELLGLRAKVSNSIGRRVTYTII